MKANNFKAGSAYMFVMITMLNLFLLITVVISVTASSRRISGYYIQFAGLYDLALAGNERVLFLLREEIDYHREEINDRARYRMYQKDIESHLVYQDGVFLLEGSFSEILREEKREVVGTFLESNFGRSQGMYYFSYRMGVRTGTYEVMTYICSGGYSVRTVVNKAIDGSRGTPTRVGGQIIWPDNLDYQVLVRPKAYVWRYKPPAWFMDEVYHFADLPINFVNIPPHHWSSENALYITDVSPINIQYFASIPTLVIYTGSDPLQIHGGSMFYGIIIAPGDIYIYEPIRGSVVAGGVVHGVGGEPDQDILFSIPMEEATRRRVFDFLGITRFGFASGIVEDMQWLLGEVRISNFELEIDKFKSIEPYLVAVKRIEN